MSRRKKSSTILGLVFVEKISGLILMIAGIILVYHTNMYMNDLGGIGLSLVAVGIILSILGLVMIIAKTE